MKTALEIAAETLGMLAIVVGVGAVLYAARCVYQIWRY